MERTLPLDPFDVELLWIATANGETYMEFIERRERERYPAPGTIRRVPGLRAMLGCIVPVVAATVPGVGLAAGAAADIIFRSNWHTGDGK